MNELPYFIAEGDPSNADKIQANFSAIKLAIEAVSVSSLSPKGAYVAGTAYVKGDMVSYQGSSYAAIGNTTGNLPTNTTYWCLVAAMGNSGATGSTGAKGDQGEVGPANELSIGTVEKGETASATITGTPPTQVLNLVLPKGDQGIQGEPGIAVIDSNSLIQTTYLSDTTNTNNYAASFAVSPGSYSVGLKVNLEITHANTGAATLNVNGLGVKNIKKNVSEALVSGDMKAGQIIPLIYDGTNFQVVGGSSVDMASIFSSIYPVGSIYMSISNTNPGTLFGGTWSAWGAGKVPVGVDTGQTEFNTVEKSGGAKTHVHGALNSMNGNLEAMIGSGNSDANSIAFKVGNQNTCLVSTYKVNGTGATAPTVINSHNTQIYGATASSSSLQPYITCYMWKRTA